MWLHDTVQTLSIPKKKSQKELHTKVAATRKVKSEEAKRELGHEKEVPG